ncbi:hypothetical protein Q6284_31870, partial [Klebsiella pneumoniae]|nr:hypothetical protein [Klebsiella pneumoniae]
MTTFTDWDIIRNLLLAGRWTVLLSLVAFTGGALVTLPLLLLRLTGGRQVKRHTRFLTFVTTTTGFTEARTDTTTQ